ncbi:FG-GAP repeat domain-containing protein [Streptomyces sp. NPDC021093]|uniref:FG-GAP repeat domain-containing protein n=1 Tax=Streptomyces sp. NPDC021093 TaxID=3365112 RepID=UPI00378F5574
MTFNKPMTSKKRGLTRTALTATALVAAMAVTAGTATAAGTPADSEKARAAAVSAHQPKAPKAPSGAGAKFRAAAPGAVETPTFSMTGVRKQTGLLDLFFADGQGGFRAAYEVGVGYDWAAVSMDVDNDKDGYSDGSWSISKEGMMSYTWTEDMIAQTKDIGGGWQIYNKVLSPGNLGGAAEADVMAVDKAGVMWVYLAYPDGRVAQRVQIGGGWQQYSEIAGQADLTGDGKADIVARDKSGTLWLYQGTGNYKAPFQARTQIGGGWNTYDRLLSIGDLDGDGKSDLVARKASGELFRYSGTGSASAPYAKPVKIGWGFQSYNLL